MSRSLSVGVACVLLVGLVVGAFGLAVGTDTEPPAPERESPTELTTQSGFASATFNVEVYENGSARWTFNYYRPTDNESERDQFREFADRFESQETDLWLNFRERARALTSAGQNSTGRNMTASGFQRSAQLDSVGNRGRVRMSFRWSEFARVEDEQVRVSDVFEGEFYIADNQWLVFEAGPNLSFDVSGVDPQPDEFSGSAINDSDTITWFGAERFPDNRPRVTFRTATSGDIQAPGSDTNPTSTQSVTTPVREGSSDGILPLVVVALIVGLIGAGAGLAWRNGVFRDDPASGDTAETTPDESGAAATETASPDPEPETTAEPAVPEEELLTDEDRVLELLESNGGRMKQANIVEETDWSKSKVSMLLSDMEDDELISKLRVGRENIVSLSGHEPEAAGSPFDDED